MTTMNLSMAMLTTNSVTKQRAVAYPTWSVALLRERSTPQQAAT
jgi:hypothetical protein